MPQGNYMSNFDNTPENGVHAANPKKYKTVEKSTTVGCLADGTPIRSKANAITEEELERKRNAIKLMHEKPRCFSNYELDVICKTIKSHRYGPLMEELLFTGMRSSEVASLKRSDVDLGKQWITVESKIRRRVLIPNVLLPTMANLCNGRKNDDLLFVHNNGSCLTHITIYRWWKSFERQCQAEAGAKLDKDNKVIPGSSLFGDSHTIHHFRGTYHMNLCSVGVGESECAVLMGHKRSGKLEKLAVWNEENFLRVAKKVNSFYDARFGSMT